MVPGGGRHPGQAGGEVPPPFPLVGQLVASGWNSRRESHREIPERGHIVELVGIILPDLPTIQNPK